MRNRRLKICTLLMTLIITALLIGPGAFRAGAESGTAGKKKVNVTVQANSWDSLDWNEHNFDDLEIKVDSSDGETVFQGKGKPSGNKINGESDHSMLFSLELPEGTYTIEVANPGKGFRTPSYGKSIDVTGTGGKAIDVSLYLWSEETEEPDLGSLSQKTEQSSVTSKKAAPRRGPARAQGDVHNSWEAGGNTWKMNYWRSYDGGRTYEGVISTMFWNQDAYWVENYGPALCLRRDLHFSAGNKVYHTLPNGSLFNAEQTTRAALYQEALDLYYPSMSQEMKYGCMQAYIWNIGPAYNDGWGPSGSTRVTYGFAGNSPGNAPYTNNAQAALSREGWKELDNKCLAYVNENYNKVFDPSGVCFFNGDFNSQWVAIQGSFSVKRPGALRIVKTSSDPNLTNGNSYYGSLNTAEYRVWCPETGYDKTAGTGGDGAAIGENGAAYSDHGGLRPGTYHIKEVKAPEGYQLDPTEYTVEVKSGTTYTQNIVRTKDTPELGDLRIIKASADPGLTADNPAYGALSTAKYRVWSDATGYDQTKTLGGNGANIGKDGCAYSDHGGMPPGIYSIQEVEAPKGYELDPTVYTVEVKPGTTVTQNVLNVSDTPVPQKGALRIVKTSADPGLTNGNPAYGALSAAKYRVWCKDTGYDKTTALTGNGGDGSVYADHTDLDPGTYSIQETEAPAGYQLDPKVYTVKVEAGSTVTQNVLNVADTPLLGALRLIKSSADTGVTSGNSMYGALTDAEFRVWCDAAGYNQTHRITGDGKDAGAAGSAYLDIANLKPGTYSIQETKAPAGYQADTKVYTVDVKAGSTATQNVLNIKNTPLLGALRLIKSSADPDMTNGSPFHGALTNAEFRVWCDAAGYNQTHRISGNGDAVGNKDAAYLDLTNLKPGRYSIQETKAPKRYKLDPTVYTVDVTPGSTVTQSVLNIKDTPESPPNPEISTTLSDTATGGKDPSSMQEVTLKDTIQYKNLWPGRSYKMTGTLYDKATGNPVEGVAPVTVDFTPDQIEGTVELSFTVPAGALKGKTVVAFEKLTFNGVTQAVHEDINDEGQTVSFPDIGTTAKLDAFVKTLTGKKIKITDTVSYTGLMPGREYTLEGRLVSRVNGQQALGGDGKEIVRTVKFTPQKADGKVDVVFEFEGEGFNFEDVVAFEQLKRENRLIASHEDINDEGQTVHMVPDMPLTGGNGFGTLLAFAGVAAVASGILLRRLSS